MLLRHCAQVPRSGKSRVETGAWIAWIMAEIEPYSFEPIRDSSESEEDDVHERQDERRRGNIVVCMQVLCKLGRRTRKRNVYDVRRSRKP